MSRGWGWAWVSPSLCPCGLFQKLRDNHVSSCFCDGMAIIRKRSACRKRLPPQSSSDTQAQPRMHNYYSCYFRHTRLNYVVFVQTRNTQLIGRRTWLNGNVQTVVICSSRRTYPSGVRPASNPAHSATLRVIRLNAADRRISIRGWPERKTDRSTVRVNYFIYD